MRVDIGNCLASVASPGVSRDALDRLDEQVAAAHERIEARRAEGTFGYAALDLPETTDPAAIRAAADPFSEAETVLTLGIGGSALGARTLTAGLGDGHGRHVTLDNIDPDHSTAVLHRLDLESTVLNVVSRSGTTVETIVNFLLAREAMEDAGVDWTARTIVTTGETGPLRELADAHDLPVVAVPPGAPGRFSALSAVGLLPAAVLGYDIEGVLNGARAEADRLTGSLFECPAYAYGAAAVALARRGAAVNAVMPYAEALEPFAEWFAQLWAESLGKDGLGQVPARALGATDQHSQLQLYRAGRRNTLVTFVRPRDRPEAAIPTPGLDEVAYLGGTSVGDVLDVAFEATEASLAEARRPSVRVEIAALDPSGLGELLFGFSAACVLAGELEGVDAFDQPAVEWGKQAARDRLRGADTEAARAVAHKTTLLVD